MIHDFYYKQSQAALSVEHKQSELGPPENRFELLYTDISKVREPTTYSHYHRTESLKKDRKDENIDLSIG